MTVREQFYGPVFILGTLRFVWFAEQLLAGSPEGAKKIGQDLTAGYEKAGIPIKSAQTVARFNSDGKYVMAQLGPEEDQRPVIALNPQDSDAEEFDQGANQQEAAVAQMDQVEEIPYDKIGDTTFVKSAQW